jgi:CheY-like chemotaxis protein
LANRAHDKHIELIYRLDPSIPSVVVGDPDRFRQVLNNLVGNAIKFTDKGEVFLDARMASAGPDQALLRVAVHDSGIGIDRADLPKLCEVFSQVDASMVRRHGGTGLGLAICKRLVNAMGGEIEVESQVGVGSVFTFTIRVGLDARPESRSSRVDLLPGKRVMLVEANPRWREVIGEHLSAWGIAYDVADRGATMLDRLTAARREASPFDVVVIGMDVHDISISDLVKRVRSHSTFGQLPVILLTTLRSDISLTDIERQFVTQLQKPIRFSELYNCLAGSFSGSFKEGPVAQLGPARTSGGRVLVVDDNEINQFVATEELERLGYQVQIASNGLEAVEKVQGGGFSAVLMDCQMPGMDGYTATREIRKWERETGTRRTPIVALTAHALVDERARVFDAGMDEYLSKPFRAASLEKILDRYVQEDEKPALPAVELAPEIKRSEKLSTLFLEKVPSQLDALAAAIEAKNAAEVKALAHKLKGGCLAIVAEPMAEAATSLEKAGDEGDLSHAPALLAELHVRHARVAELLRDELAVKRSVNGRLRESSRPA